MLGTNPFANEACSWRSGGSCQLGGRIQPWTSKTSVRNATSAASDPCYQKVAR